MMFDQGLKTELFCHSFMQNHETCYFLIFQTASTQIIKHGWFHQVRLERRVHIYLDRYVEYVFMLQIATCYTILFIYSMSGH